METPRKKRPPWWFAPVVWGAIAGSAALAAVLVGATTE